MAKYPPRPYQLEAFNAVREYFQSGGKSGLLISAQGTGKRFMGVWLSTRVAFPKTLFIVHTEELLQQAVEDFEEYHPNQVGVMKAEKNDVTKKITVASIQTLIRRYGTLSPQLFDLVVIDECHLFLSKVYLKAVKHFEPKLRISLSATPTRLDGLSMSNLSDKILFDYPIDQAIKDGYLAQIDAIRIKTDISLDKAHTSMGDFKIDELSSIVDTPVRNKLVVDSYIKYATGRQGICFAVNTEHAINLNDEFIKAGFKSEIVVANKEITEDRTGSIARFKNKELDILVNINILSTGFDYKNVGVVLMARPTQSLAFYLQAIGRVDRLKDAEYVAKFGQVGLVLDFVDSFSKHSLVNTWELDGKKPLKDRVFISDEKRKELQDKIDAHRGKAKVDSAYSEDKRVDLLRLPVVKVSNSYKMQEPATTAQIEFMKQLGVYDAENEYTKAMASEFITNHPASGWQIKKLEKWGYNVSMGATMGEFKKAKEINEPKTK